MDLWSCNILIFLFHLSTRCFSFTCLIYVLLHFGFYNICIPVEKCQKPSMLFKRSIWFRTCGSYTKPFVPVSHLLSNWLSLVRVKITYITLTSRNSSEKQHAVYGNHDSNVGERKVIKIRKINKFDAAQHICVLPTTNRNHFCMNCNWKAVENCHQNRMIKHTTIYVEKSWHRKLSVRLALCLFGLCISICMHTAWTWDLRWILSCFYSLAARECMLAFRTQQQYQQFMHQCWEGNHIA